MTANDIVTIISTVGFPIVCSGACFWYINKTGAEHKDEVNKLTEAISNNTLVIQKLLDKIGG